MRGVQPHHLPAIDKQPHLEHRRRPPKDGKRDNHGVESRIAARDPVRAPHVADGIDGMDCAAQLLLGANRVAERKTEKRKRRQSRIAHARRGAIHRKRRGDRAAQHREEGYPLHAAHAGRYATLAADIAHERVFRRRIE